MIRIASTEDYERLVPFFIENGLEFSEEDETPTDLVRCWDAEDDGRLIGGFVLEVEGSEYDWSLRGRIAGLRNKLAGGE